MSQSFVEKVTGWVGSIPSLITHTSIFVGFFILSFMGFLAWDLMFLILTTIVSLEAIYLAIFIQMTVNRQTKELEEVSEDIEEIQEDIDEIQEDVDEIQEDVDEIQEDVEEITEDEEEDERKEEERKKNQQDTLIELTKNVHKMLEELEALKRK